MSLQTHLSELTAKHRALESQIEEELSHPASDDLTITELKRKKLKLKDEITRLEAQIQGHYAAVRPAFRGPGHMARMPRDFVFPRDWGLFLIRHPAWKVEA
jgi:hypothetical protein